jgi:hypothetical protein
VLRIRFNNRRLLTSTRSKNTLFGDCPPSAAGKTQRRSASRSSSETRRRRRRSSEDAGPPRGHPASNGSVLDGTSPASGRLAVARALSRSAGERSSFLGCLTLRRSNPLTPPEAIEAERVNALLPSLFPLPQAARQCCPLSRDRGAFRRGSPDRAPSRAPAWSSAPVGHGHSCYTCSSMFEELRLDRSSRRSRGRVLAACASTTSADRCFNEHCHGPPEHPGPAESVVGTAADSIDRCLSIDGDRRGYAGSGAEDHRASALPPGIAPGRDFAPTPIASDTSCRGHCPSPCQELTRGDGQSRRRRAR